VSVQPRLSASQVSALKGWFPEWAVVADLSWGLVDTVVLHVRDRGRDVIVKAGGPGNHHIAREIAAHRAWVGSLAEIGRAPELLRADESANVLVTSYLHGQLVLGAEAEGQADTYVQAGELLARFHAQAFRVDKDYERAASARSLRWLDGSHGIAPEVEAQLRAEFRALASPVVTLVPTHGDWQPRNWLHHRGTVKMIDFGRADWRPADSDFARLVNQQFVQRPDLEAAFVSGYGSDPREPAPWRRTLLREAVGTACWAHQVGDSGFEAQGHRMIADVLQAT
jgi:aminoglycoside/choline kinase family phosphotransferase